MYFIELQRVALKTKNKIDSTNKISDINSIGRDDPADELAGWLTRPKTNKAKK